MEQELIEIKEDTLPKLKEEFQRKINDLEQARLAAELYSKKSNLLFFNIPPQTAGRNEDSEQTLRGILLQTNITDSATIQFVNVHRLPTKANPSVPKPIIAKFVKMPDRDKVLNAVNSSNITAAQDKNIIAVPHLPAPMQMERQRLVAVRNKLIAEGNTAKIRITGTLVQLYVDGTVWKN